jgi:hypothetical protein
MYELAEEIVELVEREIERILEREEKKAPPNV